MINSAELAQGLKDRLLSYMTSSLPIGNHESQRLLGQRFYEAWQRGLFKGPYFETISSYERLESLAKRFTEDCGHKGDQLFSDKFRPRYDWPDVDHKFPVHRALRDRIWSHETTEAQLEMSTTTHRALWERGLFRHQWEAFDRAVYRKANVVVATGTGSGKTECFQLPILYRLLTELSTIRTKRGVRALLVYPLNALVEDQIMRLRRLLFWVNLQFHQTGTPSLQNQQITFGRYTGDTPVNPRDHTRTESMEALKGLGELVFREDMQLNPPDILITNFTMLEYMLLREDDRQLFASPELLNFIVLDEVHTYAGTQGMEVAMLIRRLRGFLEARQGRDLPIQCIGTSATLGGADPKNQAATFATNLFGARFDSENIIIGEIRQRTAAKWVPEQWKQLFEFLSDKKTSSAFMLRPQDELSEPNIAPWKQLAQVLGVSESLSNVDAPTSEKLGTLFVHSGITNQLRTIIENQSNSCIDLDSLADLMSTIVSNPRPALGNLLSLLAFATFKHEPVIALRTHLFINEARSGQLCINPQCEQALGGTDPWWKRLYIAHHLSCDQCEAPVYSVQLCRRCGFVYLEGWRYKSELLPEQDAAERADSFERWLFRPINSDLPDAATEIGESRTLCLGCGRYFVGRDSETFAISQENHKCPANKLLDIWVWRPAHLDGGQLESCLFCEQHWISGEEVITEPAPSTYAVSSLLLEELKRQLNSAESAPKIISFSDTRQQAAQLALRLQRTNRDFTFRQLVYQILADGQLNTDDLLDELFDFCRQDSKLRLILTTEPARMQDNWVLREQLATLLYRETVTAYLTLEAQGLVRIQYDRSLLDAGKQVTLPSRITNRLTEDEREQWLIFLLDWGLRFVRYALGSHRWGGPALDYERLKEWNIYPKNAALFKDQDQSIVGFLIRQKNRRNTVFNFASRILKRGFKDVAELDIAELHAGIKPLWDSVLASPQLWVKDARTALRPLINSGGLEADRCLVQLNFSALQWRKTSSHDPLYRCDHCGRLTYHSIRGICPIRDCRGSLQQISAQDIENNEFSPVRHYRRLVSSASITPLRVEEHTAQISATKRNSIERDFRSSADDSVDVICGSTTFELGIDLGAIQSVFMANLPPRAANYRQRAGRAGRRPGAQPFVLNYVRQRPHDQYFWSDPKSFIAGPLPVPRLSITSREVVSRHISAIIVGRLLELYRKQHPGQFGLTGPPAGNFVEFSLSQMIDVTIRKEIEADTVLSKRLVGLSKSSEMSFDAPSCWSKLKAQLKALKDTYLTLYADEGTLDVLSDHGILPSYAFPIYVDELRLYECQLRVPPRADLKLQRDRSMALREYSPGRAFVAGKYQILSEGLWQGYEVKNFDFCPRCSTLDFHHGSNVSCHQCQTPLLKKKAVVPKGGFFGRIIRSNRESIEQTFPAVTDVYFDPADDPPPKTQSVGKGMNIALLDARQMTRSRMRMFNPRPNFDGMLMSARNIGDAALPHSPAAHCLERVSKGPADSLHLMHEFTTDILQMKFLDNEVGRLMLGSSFLEQELRTDVSKREWLYDSVWLTIATAVALSGAQTLDIDPTEIAVVVRRSLQPGILGTREIILYDTTAGGAGYARQLGECIPDLFRAAAARITKCDCQDSCYACLRNYHNQLIHSRLHRKRLLEGFSDFVQSTFP